MYLLALDCRQQGNGARQIPGRRRLQAMRLERSLPEFPSNLCLKEPIEPILPPIPGSKGTHHCSLVSSCRV